MAAQVSFHDSLACDAQGRRCREDAGLGGICWTASFLNASVIDEVTSKVYLKKGTSTWLLSADLEDWSGGIVTFEDESGINTQKAARHIT